MNQNTFTLTSCLPSLQDIQASIVDAQLDKAKQKKHARIQVSLDHTSAQLGFIHGALLQLNNRHFIIAGPSGVGKSTVADYLREHFGATIIANDWVAVQKEGNTFLCSDLNFPDQIRQQTACKLDGVVFLQAHDKLKRDAYVPNKRELIQLLANTYDENTNEECSKLSKFWADNYKLLPFYCAIPTKHTTPAQTGVTMLLTLQRSRPINEAAEVGVIGVGSVGSHLAYELGKLPFVRKVHLYDHTIDKTVGYSLDLNQAVTKKGEEVFVAHSSPENVFRRSSSVFICFRDKNATVEKSLPERWQRVQAHMELVKHYVAAACASNYAGAIFVVTNPVDFLSYGFYQSSQKYDQPLRTFQVYGVGLECDMARALFYGKKYSPLLQRKDIQLYGSHDDNYEIATPLKPAKATLLKQDVATASETIRSYGNIRTVYSPIAGIIHTYLAYANSQSAYITSLHSGAYMGGKVMFKFGLPCLPQQEPAAAYNQLLSDNQSKVAKYQAIM